MIIMIISPPLANWFKRGVRVGTNKGHLYKGDHVDQVDDDHHNDDDKTSWGKLWTKHEPARSSLTLQLQSW